MENKALTFQKMNPEEHNNYLSNYFSLELTEYFFDNIIKQNFQIDLFLNEFKNNIKQVIFELLNHQSNKVLVTNVFKYYALICINNEKRDQKQLVFDSCFGKEELSTEVQDCLDDYFYHPENQQSVIKTKCKNITIILTPLANLDKIIF